MSQSSRTFWGGVVGPAVLALVCGGQVAKVVPLEEIRARYGAPALGAASIRDGRLSWLEVVGVRRLGDPTLATPADRFHLGSCGKAMTATLVATFVDEGRLGWDDSLGEAWPELAPLMHPDFRRVTVRQLLAHRAGIDDEALIARYGPSLDASLPLPEQRRWVAERVLSGPARRPGEHAYSNLGYTVVGALLEQIGGASWEELMARRLFEPLGMGACGFGAPGTPGLVDQPWGHREQGGQLLPVPPGSDADPAVLAPAGGVHCSLEDWSKFVILHLQGARGEASLVSRASFENMHGPWPGGSYALGWAVDETSSGPVLSHTGSNERFHAAVVLRPQERRAAMAAANSGGRAGEGATGDALGAVLALR